MADDRKLPTVLPELSPHTRQDTEPVTAEQGPPPTDFATRPVPPTPQPSGEHLSAEEVATLVGREAQTVDPSQQAGGLDSDRHS